MGRSWAAKASFLLHPAQREVRISEVLGLVEDLLALEVNMSRVKVLPLPFIKL